VVKLEDLKAREAHINELRAVDEHRAMRRYVKLLQDMDNAEMADFEEFLEGDYRHPRTVEDIVRDIEVLRRWNAAREDVESRPSIQDLIAVHDETGEDIDTLANGDPQVRHKLMSVQYRYLVQDLEPYASLVKARRDAANRIEIQRTAVGRLREIANTAPHLFEDIDGYACPLGHQGIKFAARPKRRPAVRIEYAEELPAGEPIKRKGKTCKTLSQ
jgi:hypothetical protein